MQRNLQLLAFIPALLVVAVPVLAAPAGQPVTTDTQPTDTDALLLVTYVLLALIVSFLCSIAEAVLLSITPSYVEGLRELNPRLYGLLTQLKRERLDRSLAAILTLNTIAHTVGAIGAGAKATIVFGSAWFGLFSALMTLAILFVSEIIPKTLGAVHWARLAGPTVVFIRLIVWLLFPIVYLSELLTKLLARDSSDHAVTREEFLAMARIGQASGHIRSSETRMISSLLQFNDLKLEDVMTPRTVIQALPEDLTVADAMPEVARLPFSRLPVYQRDIDHITGFVRRDDILMAQAEGRAELTLRDLRRNIRTVPESLSTPAMLSRLLAEQQHIALVVDEFGGTAGVVTLEDLLETLTGMEIVDETDAVTSMREAARSRRLRRRPKRRSK